MPKHPSKDEIELLLTDAVGGAEAVGGAQAVGGACKECNVNSARFPGFQHRYPRFWYCSH